MLTIENLQDMDWKRFERLCQQYFQCQGYETRLTNARDGGVDIVLEKALSDEKKQRVYVNCNIWPQPRAGMKNVQSLFKAMDTDDVLFGMILSVNGFSAGAKAYAHGRNIRLISEAQFLPLLAQLSEDDQERLAQDALEENYSIPTCPACGLKMVFKAASKGIVTGGSFWRCQSFPCCEEKVRIKGRIVKEGTTASAGFPEGSMELQESTVDLDAASSVPNRRSSILAGALFCVLVAGLAVKGGFVGLDWLNKPEAQPVVIAPPKPPVKKDVIVQASSVQISSAQPSVAQIKKIDTVDPAPILPEDEQLEAAVSVALTSEPALERNASEDDGFVWEKLTNHPADQAAAKVKGQAWTKWYEAEAPWGCGEWRSGEHMVECVNHRKKARLRFEKLWAEGRFTGSRG
ncbi:restriction endonuclease [uncultured Endozoicomonas sp.]|uniref:restriction endonuclease n=1 Tax=uncultured Endozoicomonas sp. TaxID=432652 RepID=UPI002605FD6B|nr:restriction endonuclease [uncultured Endozoicomonas sp.]